MSTPVPGVVAVVPAAGASRRFGGRKLLADIEGEPLLQHTLRCLLDAGISRVVLVTNRPDDFDAVSLVHDDRLTRIVNSDPERGMFSSVQVGVAASDASSSILVLPADMPFVDTSTVRLVLDAHAADGSAVVAMYGGRRGHPIVLPAHVREPLLAHDATSSLKVSLQSSGITPRAIDVNDPGVLRDVDVQADLP